MKRDRQATVSLNGLCSSIRPETCSRRALVQSLSRRGAGEAHSASLRTWGLVALAVVAALVTSAGPARAEVTTESFSLEAASPLAGGHTDSTTTFSFATRQNAGDGFFYPLGGLPENILLHLPAGLIGNPNATPKCPRSQQDDFNARECPADTQVGAGTVVAGGFGPLAAQVYNMVPGPDEPARLAIQPDAGTAPSIVTFTASAADSYALTAAVDDVSTSAPLLSSDLTLWAVPADHNGSAALGRIPFMEYPTDCSESPVTTLQVNTYEDPTRVATATASSPQPTGCRTVPFNPSIALTADTTEAGAPTGLSVELRVPQNQAPEGQGASELERAVVTLPQGMTISPSAASKLLEGCTNEQFGAGSDAPATCPAASVIGEDVVESPLLPAANGGEGALRGRVYLGQPLSSDPQSGQMFRLFQELKGFGLDIKMEGSVAANPETGQLTATFAHLPELPFQTFKLHFTDGPNAVLANPSTCGAHRVTTQLYPYSNPTIPATPSSTFDTSYDGSGSPCPGTLPFAPSASISSASTQAGALSPLSVTFGHANDTQPLGQIDARLPEGLLGYVSKVALCEGSTAVAGTCGPESRIGSVTTSAGPGDDPLTVQGSAYLARGSNGYPFMLSVVVPAVAGPYDLGNVVVPVWLQVDSDGSITAVSGALPSILDGIPLDIRSVTMTFDRPGFTLNPTNCKPLSLTGIATSLSGTIATFSAPFQVSDCASLPFAPSFTAATTGSTSKSDGASLTVRITQKLGEADIHSVHVELPKQLSSRLTTLQKACPETQFASNPAGCPTGSVVGTAIAFTPTLSSPLAGPAILISHGDTAFPDLEIVLQGEGVTVILDGGTDIKKGITSSTFASVPDVPIAGFELTLPEGPYSLLSPNGTLCENKLLMPTTIVGQNGTTVMQSTRIAVTGCAPAKLAVKVTKTVLKGSDLVVTVVTSAGGNVEISGAGLRTTAKNNVKPGAHRIAVALSEAAKALRHRRGKLKLRVSLTLPTQSVAKTTSVRL